MRRTSPSQLPQRDGEGDIGCLAWFHPATGSRDILYLGASARGLARRHRGDGERRETFERIRFIGCDVHVRGPGNGAFDNRRHGQGSRLELIGTRLVSDGGGGARFYQTRPSPPRPDHRRRRGSCSATTAAPSRSALEALGITDPNRRSDGDRNHIDASSRASWTGGRIEGRGPVGKRVPLYGSVANVTLSETTEVAGRTRYFKVMETYGVRPITHQGAGTSSVTVELPNAVADRDRTHLAFTIRRETDGYLADRVTGSWAFIDDRNVRVWLIGDATLATKAKLCVHFVEWGERS